MKTYYLDKTEDFENLKKEFSTIIIQFSASWCGPCKRITPIIQNYLAPIENDSIVYLYCDIDIHDSLAEEFSVNSIPCFSIVKNKKDDNGSVNTEIAPLSICSGLSDIIIYLEQNNIYLNK